MPKESRSRSRTTQSTGALPRRGRRNLHRLVNRGLMAPTSIRSWSRKAGAGDTGSMLLETSNLRSWRRTHEKPKRVCGQILHRFRLGFIGRQSEGNHSTCLTSCRWMLTSKVARRLVTHHSWELLANKTPHPPLQHQATPSSAIERVTSISGLTARTTARLHRRIE